MDTKAVKAFEKLGVFMAAFAEGGPKPAGTDIPQEYYDAFEELIISQQVYNGWFTANNIRTALKALGQSLAPKAIQAWLAKYDAKVETPKKVAIIMAGNIPLAGFHDFMCVLLAGHTVVAKLSSQDNRLLPFLAKVLEVLEPALKDRMIFADGMIKDANAYIATGSNNSSRYFDYYFGKYPNIIRKNRNSVAVLSGNETEEELMALGADIFLYFGLGCRSVSKLYLPVGYDFAKLIKVLESWKGVFENKKYANNYDYTKAIYLLNKVVHIDGGFLMLKEDAALASPVSVVYFSYYRDVEQLADELNSRIQDIQCIVSSTAIGLPVVPFGQAQYPTASDYADGVDTLNFLLNI